MAQREDVNWAPLSEVMVEGTAYLEIHVSINTRTQDAEVVEVTGTASGHLEVLSIIVNR